jgi:hypothetical protein
VEDIYSSTFKPEQTVALQSMFQKCGFSGAEWVDIPAWLVFAVAVPATGGGLLANQKQSVGSAQGADFYLRRIQTINLSAGGSPQVLVQIKLPTGRYLQGGNFGGSFAAAANAGVLTPGPLGLVKPEVKCPAGTNFTIDLLNVTNLYTGNATTEVVTLVFEGVYRYRLETTCAA